LELSPPALTSSSHALPAVEEAREEEEAVQELSSLPFWSENPPSIQLDKNARASTMKSVDFVDERLDS
jgi:hypothetical protein